MAATPPFAGAVALLPDRQYALLSPYFARWAQYGLLVALFRPLGSIRALARLCAHMRCAHTPRFLRSAAPSDTHAIPRFLRSAAPSH